MKREIFLRRKEIMNHLPKAVRAEAVSKLSSVYVNRQPLKGFSMEEEKRFMNGILDVNPDHVDWPKHSKLFWAVCFISSTCCFNKRGNDRKYY